MDIPKNNLEAAADRKNLATKVPSSKNKESFDWFDDTMPSADDWMDYDVDDEDKSAGNQSDIDESPPETVTKIPPKDHRSSSAVSSTSPKNKKRKLPNFDEILQNLNYNTLSLKFTKLLKFLGSDNKELALAFTSKEYEEVFIIIMKDINILKSKSLDAFYRHICDQIIRATSGYSLSYVYEYKTEFQKIVMVIRKEKNKMVDQSEGETSSFSWSEECTKSSSHTSSEADTKELSRISSRSTISSGFKLHCLRTMLAFIKYDETKSKEFPELSLDQAHYMQSLLRYSSGAFNNFEKNLEVKDLHRSLWEAMKIYSLKFEFKITCEDSWAGKKNLIFEKIPKQKSGAPFDSNQITNPTTEIQMSEIPKSEIQKPESPTPDVSEHRFAKPEIPPFVPVQEIKQHITKKMLKKQIKQENEALFIKRQPTQFVTDTLNLIHEFLLDDTQHKLVLVPKTHTELEFYRKVIDWCKAWYSVAKFGEEFERLHYMIQSQLSRVNIKATKGSHNKYNETTGIKQITYIKVPLKHKHFDSDSVQSAPKKKKVNLQNVLELAGTEKVQLASVVDLNQSLRNKKKNKKQKKAKLKQANAVASNGATARANKAYVWTDDSSSSCSSRATSANRAGAVPKAQPMTNSKTSSKLVKTRTEDSRSGCSSRATSRDRSEVAKAQHMPRRPMKENRREEATRKEQLIEALSVPVQSDKAMRMMRGMGWNGGALGARGVGITEPLMPKLDLPKRSGFGHTRNSQPEPTAKKPKDRTTTTSFVSENSKVIKETENDNTVKKTKQLLLENSRFVSTKKTVEQSGSNVELSKSSDCNVELSKPIVELPAVSNSNVELPATKKSNVELPAQSKSNVELPKPETPFTCLVISPRFSRQEYLHSIYELLNSDSTYKTLKYQNVIPMKARRFVTKSVQVINDRIINYGIFLTEEFPIYTQIHVKCKKNPHIFVDAAFLYDFKSIELKKTPPDRQMPIEINMPTELNMPTESVTPQQNLLIDLTETNTEIITEEQIKSYIFSTNSQYSSPKAFAQLKFKVLFLLNILNFVKSLNEEVEVTFNKILGVKEKTYIENVVDEVNMRIKFGSSPAETELCSEIKQHVKGAFLGAMFNHHYTVVTLNKYYRFKRLNRPDNAVKRKCQTTVNLDIYKSETVSQAKVNIHEPTDRENNNKVAENYNFADSCSEVAEKQKKINENGSKDSETNSTAAEKNSEVAENNNYEEVLLESSDDDITNPYDSDESSVEEYNNNNATTKVPRLSPGEENVNVSNFLYLYDKAKHNSVVKNNIDNDSASNVTANINNKNNIGNGNVVIDNNDNQIIDMKRDVRMDEIESEIDSDDAEYHGCVEMSVDIGKEDEEVNITDNESAGLNEQPIEHSDITATNDGRLVNNHENIVVDNLEKMIEEDLLKTDDSDIEDFNSHYDCWEDIVSDEINYIPENQCKYKDIKDQNVVMKENVTEMMEVISITDKEDLVKVTNEEKGVEVTKINDEISINPNDDQNVIQENKNVDTKTDCDKPKEENIVLSEKSCDTQSVLLKVSTEINVPDTLHEVDSEIKTVRIVHSCHPLAKLTKENVTEIQKHISNAIMLTIELPLLKCHGVQYGALVYTCHNQKTYDWLRTTISVASSVKVLNTEKVTKMALKFYCFFDYSSSLYLFKMIELYNRELSTENWVVEKTEKEGDYVIFIVKMDKFSIKFIQEAGLSLFAGVDKVQFSPIWE